MIPVCLADCMGADMNDKELADKLVELGILYRNGNIYYLNATKQWLGGDTETVRDWRVTGAMIEKVGGIYLHKEPHLKGKWHVYAETDRAVRLPVDHATHQDESLPRAINIACFQALGGSDG